MCVLFLFKVRLTSRMNTWHKRRKITYNFKLSDTFTKKVTSNIKTFLFNSHVLLEVVSSFALSMDFRCLHYVLLKVIDQSYYIWHSISPSQVWFLKYSIFARQQQFVLYIMICLFLKVCSLKVIHSLFSITYSIQHMLCILLLS